MNLTRVEAVEPADSNSSEDEQKFSGRPETWPIVGRFAFRFIFIFLLLALTVTFAPLGWIPYLGPKMSGWIDSLSSGSAQWIAHHVFHLAGLAAQDHATDSRDTAIGWITLGFNIVLSLVAATIWSVLDRRRTEYRNAAVWLRFLLRLLLVFLMLRYGIGKVFPLQMSAPSIAVLNEPLGQTSSFTLFWTLMGLHPSYEMLCGSVECLAAVLLIFPRTSLMGAILNTFVMTNVLIDNMFFNVPVKLGAALILLTTIALLAPDLRSLYDYLWHHKLTAPTSLWTPRWRRRSSRIAAGILQTAFVALTLYYYVPGAFLAAKQQREKARHPSPLVGEWRVDSDLLTLNGRTVGKPVITAEGQPMTALYLEPSGLVMVRSADGRLWRAGAAVDLQKRTFALYSPWFEGVRFEAAYTIVRLDENHMVLTPTPDEASTFGTLNLSRTPLPTNYPLLEKDFHWVQEWALER